MAEDFHAAFGLGPDAEYIAPKDLAGVAMAAAKGLNAELEKQLQRINRLSIENARLASQNAELKQRLQKLEEVEKRLSELESHFPDRLAMRD